MVALRRPEIGSPQARHVGGDRAGAGPAVRLPLRVGRWRGPFAANAIGFALARGVRSAYLQVAPGNTAALALYGRLGFAVHHEYAYLVGGSSVSATTA